MGQRAQHRGGATRTRRLNRLSTTRYKGLPEILDQHEIRDVAIELRKADDFLVLRNREAGAAANRRPLSGREANVFELLTRVLSQYPKGGRGACADEIKTMPRDRPVAAGSAWRDQP